MKMTISLLFSVALITIVDSVYEASWDDLERRHLPQWYESAKIGILIHWGIYSIPAYPKGRKSELFWKRWTDNETGISDYVKKHYGHDFQYQDFAPMFTAERFNQFEWAELFVKSGAKYVVLTAKHHDGFALFPSHNSSGWNAKETGPKMDVVKAVAMSIRMHGLKFGVYYSLAEWYNPLFLRDKSKDFVVRLRSYAERVVLPDIEQLVVEYQPSVLWADGAWDAPDSYWHSKEILSWLYSKSHVKDEIVVNDRWGSNVMCRHGDFMNCRDTNDSGKIQTRKWENAFSLDKKSWGFRNKMASVDVLSAKELVKTIVATVSCGGNALINIGPTAKGEIPRIFRDVLLQLGRWLKINGEAIYGTSPWFKQRDSFNQHVWYTCRKTHYNFQQPIALPSKEDIITEVYVIVLKWPLGNMLIVKDLANHLIPKAHQIDLVQGNDTYIALNWDVVNGEVTIFLPSKKTIISKFAIVLCVRLFGIGNEELENSDTGFTTFVGRSALKGEYREGEPSTAGRIMFNEILESDEEALDNDEQ